MTESKLQTVGAVLESLVLDDIGGRDKLRYGSTTCWVRESRACVEQLDSMQRLSVTSTRDSRDIV